MEEELSFAVEKDLGVTAQGIKGCLQQYGWLWKAVETMKFVMYAVEMVILMSNHF